jgi:hypothetical protein
MNKIFLGISLVIGFVGLALADPAAPRLYTAPLQVGWSTYPGAGVPNETATAHLRCMIVNRGDQTRRVSINVHWDNPFQDSSLADQEIEAGKIVVFDSIGLEPGLDEGFAPAYCEFVLSGAKEQFRASGCVINKVNNIPTGPESCLNAD